MMKTMNGLSCARPLLQGTGVNYHEAQTLISDFCAATANSIISPATNETGSLKTAIGNSDILFTISYTTAQQTHDARCSLDPDVELTISESTCQNTFSRLLDECDTTAASSSSSSSSSSLSSGHLGKYGGTVTSGCAVYTMSTAPEELIVCGNNPYPRPTAMPLRTMDEGITEYCNTPLELTPDYTPSDKFLIDTPRGQSLGNYVRGDVVVKTAAQFNRQGQVGCGLSRPFRTDGEECRRKLSSIRDRCGAKGGVLSENGRNGCVLWTIWGQRAT